MQALVKRQAGRGLVLEERPRPSCSEHNVVVRIQKTGVCGTDVHIYGWDDWAAHRLRPPLIIGHEFMGVVEEVGQAVEDIQPATSCPVKGTLAAVTASSAARAKGTSAVR